MNTDSQQDWTQKLQDLETEIYESSQQSQTWLNKVRNWFLTLPMTGKIIAGVLGLIFALSLLNTVFWLVRLSISLAIFFLIVYFVYNFFKKDKNQE
jgi:ABC-type lipoprotein release transport system permease subunit